MGLANCFDALQGEGDGEQHLIYASGISTPSSTASIPTHGEKRGGVTVNVLTGTTHFHSFCSQTYSEYSMTLHTLSLLPLGASTEKTYAMSGWLIAHIVLMSLSWGICIPVAALMPMFFKPFLLVCVK